MLVILMENQLVSPQQVCPTCLMADQGGQPRWQQGKLRCGWAVGKQEQGQPNQYECQMGFRIADIH
ncbi:hypothetical protein [Leptolyngbya sp. FACHB-711]|uniref:hypothetical protein n=1 Tax=unclassified Leptolyngbya TaxID=2650499 RepID=UPI00168286DF|nr:hypothetical protein [Leptolyngbya sp. FACHB-711]MBD1850452.1 hypothetical protein [Cyanobacteria bacterium FACHB-502]MBD2026046.1 hypothetical protein [Leptolyngbya sp. FACHB-711]